MDLLELTVRKPPTDKKAVVQEDAAETEGSDAAFALSVADAEGEAAAAPEGSVVEEPAPSDRQLPLEIGWSPELEGDTDVPPTDTPEDTGEVSVDAEEPDDIGSLSTPERDDEVFITRSPSGQALFTATAAPAGTAESAVPERPPVPQASQPDLVVEEPSESPPKNVTPGITKTEERATAIPAPEARIASVPTNGPAASGEPQVSKPAPAPEIDAIQAEEQPSLPSQPAPATPLASPSIAAPTLPTPMAATITVHAEALPQDKRPSRTVANEASGLLATETNATETVRQTSSKADTDKKIVQFLTTAGATRPAVQSEVQITNAYQSSLASTSVSTVNGAPANTASAPAAAPLSTLVQVPPAMVDRSLLPQIVGAVQTVPSGGTIDLMLDPPELGRIEITLELGENNLRATLNSERASTGELIRRHSAMLAQHFSDAGFENIDLSFAEPGEQDPRGFADPQGTSSEPDSVGQPTTTTSSAAAAPLVAAGRIDLRL